MSTICSVSSGSSSRKPRLPVKPALFTRSPTAGCRFAILRGDLVHLRAVGDVARLGLRPDLGRHLLELLGSAGDEDAVPASRGEKAGGRGSDSARPSRDDGDPHAATINSSRFG